jgi:hypothetical protein
MIAAAPASAHSSQVNGFPRRPAPMRLAAKMSQDPTMISFRPGTSIRFTTVAPQSSIQFLRRGLKTMIIATVLFIAVVLATGAAIVKAYEWHQDVLYGP